MAENCRITLCVPLFSRRLGPANQSITPFYVAHFERRRRVSTMGGSAEPRSTTSCWAPEQRLAEDRSQPHPRWTRHYRAAIQRKPLARRFENVNRASSGASTFTFLINVENGASSVGAMTSLKIVLPNVLSNETVPVFPLLERWSLSYREQPQPSHVQCISRARARCWTPALCAELQ